MKRTRKEKRLLAVALAALLAITGMPAAVFADVGSVDESGLCDHHRSHTAGCGYEKGHPCEHEHTKACHTDVLRCGLIEDEDIPVNTDSNWEKTGGHRHRDECYELDCPHERGNHDENCKYTEEQSCGYDCQELHDNSLLPDVGKDKTEEQLGKNTMKLGRSYKLPEYQIRISPDKFEFPSAEAEYTVGEKGDVLPMTVVVYNEGSSHETSLFATLEKWEAFELSGNISWEEGQDGGTGHFTSITLAPKSGLSAGVYTDTLTVQGTGTPAVTAPVSFTVEPGSADFVAVTEITGVPTFMTAGEPLTLTSTVEPSNATNQTIAWSIEDAGSTGAVLNGSSLSATSAGKVKVKATVANGEAEGTPYTQSFTITVNPPEPAFVAVTEITEVPASMTVGTLLPLTGTVEPSDATNKTIKWSIEDAGSTGAALNGSSLSATSAGQVKVRATVADGTAAGVPYTQSFTITVNPTEPTFVAVTNITRVPIRIYVGSPRRLTGTVEPSNATNDYIEWSLEDAGTTGAVLNGSNLTATSPGQVKIRATIEDGTVTGDYEQVFLIEVLKRTNTDNDNDNNNNSNNTTNNTNPTNDPLNLGEGDTYQQETTDGKFIVIKSDPTEPFQLFDENGNLEVKIFTAGGSGVIVRQPAEQPDQESINKVLGGENTGTLIGGMEFSPSGGNGAVPVGGEENAERILYPLVPRESEQRDSGQLAQEIQDQVRRAEELGVNMGIVRDRLPDGANAIPLEQLEILERNLATMEELVRKYQEQGQQAQPIEGENWGTLVPGELISGESPQRAEELPSQGAQQAAPSQGAQQAAPVQGAQQAAPAQGAQQAAPAQGAQQAGPAQGAQQAAPAQGAQQAAPAQGAQQGGQAGQNQHVSNWMNNFLGPNWGFLSRGGAVQQTGRNGQMRTRAAVQGTVQGMEQTAEQGAEQDATQPAQESFMFLIPDERIIPTSRVTTLHKVGGQWIEEFTLVGKGFVVVMGVKSFESFALVADPGTLALTDKPDVCTYQPKNISIQDKALQAEVSATGIQTAIDLARKLAEQSGETFDNVILTIDLSVSAGPGAVLDTCQLTLSRDACKKLAEAGVQRLDVKTRQLSLSLDAEMLKAVYSADRDVSIQADMATKRFTVK